MWAPPVLIWFINPINYSYLRFINHSYWSYVHRLSYHLGAPLCRWEVFKTLWHPVFFVLGNGIPWMIIIPWLMFRWFSYSKKGWHVTAIFDYKRWVCVFHNLPHTESVYSPMQASSDSPILECWNHLWQSHWQFKMGELTLAAPI